ncbi:hypothetical protein ES332_D08G085200v1 [Gossypium tomentosum]|uniref:Uncharacterized protein n=1 Tax=Gossypium tomentosum TaxID=34277 RepID=A0A5D2JS64_GOSTO|nr:hypothetical protein ES332_D08G085200v1 [Gossypium tomentosum]
MIMICANGCSMIDQRMESYLSILNANLLLVLYHYHIDICDGENVIAYQ